MDSVGISNSSIALPRCGDEPARIDRQADTGNRSGIIAGEEADGICDIFGRDQLAESSVGGQRVQVTLTRFDCGLHGWGQCVARRDGVDTNTRSPPFRGQTLSEGDDGGFGRSVGVERCRSEAGDGSDIDDGAISASGHSRSESTTSEVRPTVVNVHHTVEFVDAQVVGWVRRLQDAGARDEDVDGPDVLLDGIGRCVDGRVGPDIQLDCVAPQTFRDLARRL
jgi:hypothetical protein